MKTMFSGSCHFLRRLFLSNAFACGRAAVLRSVLLAAALQGLALAGPSPSVSAAPSPAAPFKEEAKTSAPLAARRLLGTLLDAGGRPLAGTTVSLTRADETNFYGFTEAAKRKHFHSITDAAGRFDFSFLPAVAVGAANTTDSLPGPGVYYAVADPAPRAGHAGGISARIVNPDARAMALPAAPAGSVLLADGAAPKIVVHCEKGVSITVRVIDSSGKPLAGKILRMVRPLPYEPGRRQGEMFYRSGWTDANGRHVFDGLYPSTQTLNVDVPCWTRTRVGGNVIFSQLTQFNPADPQCREIEVWAAPAFPQHELWGTVKTPDGRLADQAEIEVLTAQDKSMLGRPDVMKSLTARSANGTYSLMLDQHWVYQVSARLRGEKPFLATFPNGLETGELNIQFKPAPEAKLRGTLLDADGRPLPGAVVYLIGLDRMDMVMMDEVSRLPHYQARTGAQGQFEFVFKMVPYFEADKEKDKFPFLSGYRAVVLPAPDGSHGGAVSDLMELSSGGDGGNVPPLPVLKLQAARPVSLEGRLLGHGLKPVPGVSVSICLDLHMQSHTGFGGEIFEHSTVTDAQGRFLFTGLYPSTQTLTLGGEGKGSLPWMRTRIGKNGKWVDESVNQLNLDNPEQRYVEIHAEKMTFTYQGMVRDSAGRPVAGARVSVGVSAHRVPQDYGDTHDTEHVETDAAGHYEFKSSYPWVTGMWADKGDMESKMLDPPRDASLPPGRYDFVLLARARR